MWLIIMAFVALSLILAYARSLGNYNYEIWLHGLQLKAEVARLIITIAYYSLAETPTLHTHPIIGLVTCTVTFLVSKRNSFVIHIA